VSKKPRRDDERPPALAQRLSRKQAEMKSETKVHLFDADNGWPEEWRA
jgi:hypothetical protein